MIVDRETLLSIKGVKDEPVSHQLIDIINENAFQRAWEIALEHSGKELAEFSQLVKDDALIEFTSGSYDENIHTAKRSIMVSSYLNLILIGIYEKWAKNI